MDADANEAAVRAALDLFNAGDLDGYLALMDEGCTVYGFAPEPIGLHGVRRIVERWQNGDMFGLLVQLGAIPAPA